MNLGRGVTTSRPPIGRRKEEFFSAQDLYKKRMRKNVRSGTNYRISRGVQTSSAQVLRRLKRLEKGQVGKELKYHDVNHSATSSTTGSIECINLIAQGNDDTEREGREILLQSIYGKMEFKAGTASDFNYTYRTMIVLDTQNDGTTPGIGDILMTVNTYSFREMASTNRQRFRILYDKVTVVPNIITGVQNSRWREYYKRFKNPIKLEYDGTAAAIGSCSGKAMFVLTFGNTGANHGSGNVNLRLRYTD